MRKRFWYFEFYDCNGRAAKWWKTCEKLSEICSVARQIKGQGILRIIAPLVAASIPPEIAVAEALKNIGCSTVGRSTKRGSLLPKHVSFFLRGAELSAMPFAASSLRASACVCGMFVRRCPELPTAYYNRSEVAKCISNAQNAQNSCATPAGFTPGVQTLAAR